MAGFRALGLQILNFPGLGFRVSGFGFRVSGLGFGVWGLGFGVWGLGFGVFRVSGLEGLPLNSQLNQGNSTRGIIRTALLDSLPAGWSLKRSVWDVLPYTQSPE